MHITLNIERKFLKILNLGWSLGSFCTKLIPENSREINTISRDFFRFPRIQKVRKKHPPLESILGLDFNEHGKTLYYSIFCPFCYTVGVSHFLFMEGFPYRGKMDIIYTKLWDFERVSQYDLYRIIVFITHLYSGNSIIYASVA